MGAQFREVPYRPSGFTMHALVGLACSFTAPLRVCTCTQYLAGNPPTWIVTGLIPRPPPRSYLAAVSVISIVKVNPLGITIAGTIIFQVYGVQICN